MVPAKLTSYAIEILYGTFVAFFYTYVFLTLVTIKPFSFGFHPPTNVEQLSFLLLVIFLGMAVIKCIALVADLLTAERDASRPISYFPSQRH